MTEEKPRQFDTIQEWHDWLEENHQTTESLWVIIQKKASKKPGIRYEAAVLEAVAFGWIDGQIKRIDDDEFMQRYTPRRPSSIWSKSNKKRVEKLIKEGRMTPAGLEKVEEAKKNGQWEKAYTSRAPVEIPKDLLTALSAVPEALKNFKAFPQSARFMYIHWINEAKREKTRERRIYTVVVRSENNQRPGIDLRVINP
ncbi:MAG: YdeI/OmpD-associated family protein [Candidatus Bathyarchaeota archaeon]|nr:YdeI/OmpD-associated family protein [Candidatus Bathyarchaeota archaeon]